MTDGDNSERFERMSRELVAWADPSGMSPSVLLQLTEPLRSTLRGIMRDGPVTFERLSERLELPMSETEEIAELLVECGFLKTSEEADSGEIIYSIRHNENYRSGSPVAAWNKLLFSDGDPEEAG